MSNGQTPARRQQSPPPADSIKPKRELTKAEVQEQLRRRSESMDGHISGLQQELQASGKEAQEAAERTVQQYTLAVLGGLGAAGAAVGYWLVRRRRKKRRALASRTWMDEYRDAVRDEVRAAAKRGDDPGEVAGRIMEGRHPLVVQDRSTPSGSKGWVRTTVDLAARTLISFAVTYVMKAASERFLPAEEAGQVEEGSEAAAPVTSAVSSQE